MSALPRKQTFANAIGMSALCQKGDQVHRSKVTLLEGHCATSTKNYKSKTIFTLKSTKTLAQNALNKRAIRQVSWPISRWVLPSDDITMLFAAVHESGYGPSRTSRARRSMSDVWVRADIASAQAHVAL
jgi:hypothetical protein